MELIEYRGFDNIFIGLSKEGEQYYVIYGRTGPAEINCIEEDADVMGGRGDKVLRFCRERRIDLNVPFIQNNRGAITNISSIPHKSVYYTIINILESLL